MDLAGAVGGANKAQVQFSPNGSFLTKIRGREPRAINALYRHVQDPSQIGEITKGYLKVATQESVNKGALHDSVQKIEAWAKLNVQLGIAERAAKTEKYISEELNRGQIEAFVNSLDREELIGVFTNYNGPYELKQFIPEQYREDFEVKDAAYYGSMSAFKSKYEGMEKLELIDALNEEKHYDAWEFIPERYKQDPAVVAAVIRHGRFDRYEQLPLELRKNADVASAAVANTFYAMRAVPEGVTLKYDISSPNRAASVELELDDSFSDSDEEEYVSPGGRTSSNNFNFQSAIRLLALGLIIMNLNQVQVEILR